MRALRIMWKRTRRIRVLCAAAAAIHDGIDEMTAANHKIGLDDCQALQTDFRCIPGERLRDCFAESQAMVEAEVLSKVEAAALQVFLSWDGRMDPDSVGATLYELVSDAMADHLFEHLV